MSVSVPQKPQRTKQKEPTFVLAKDLILRWDTDKSTITRLRQRGIINGYRSAYDGRVWLYHSRHSHERLAKYFQTDLVSAEAVALRWGVHTNTIMRLRRDGVLTGRKVRMGKWRWLYDARQVDAQLAKYFGRAAPAS